MPGSPHTMGPVWYLTRAPSLVTYFPLDSMSPWPSTDTAPVTGAVDGGGAPRPPDSDLLEVGGEAVHVLVVGQQGLGLRLEEVDVPDAQEGQQDGRVGLQRGAAEVLVLRRRAETLGEAADEPSPLEETLANKGGPTIQWAPDRSCSKLSKPGGEKKKKKHRREPSDPEPGPAATAAGRRG